VRALCLGRTIMLILLHGYVLPAALTCAQASLDLFAFFNLFLKSFVLSKPENFSWK